MPLYPDLPIFNQLLLQRNPAAALETATKQYVDSGTTSLTTTALTVNGRIAQTDTNTNPSTDFYHLFCNNAVQYTAAGTQGDTIGIVSQLFAYANGHVITQSAHTAGIYGIASLGPDGNAAGDISQLNGVMAGSAMQGSGILRRGVDFFAHAPIKSGSGRFIDHYAFYQESTPVAEHEYGAFFGGNVGIGADTPQYCLSIVPGVNNASATNWMNVGSGTGTLIMTSGGCYLYPAYNPGPGGFGATDIIVGFNGQQNPTNSTQYFLYVSSCAGPPTGVPAQAGAGIPLVVDSVNHKLYMYIAGVWRSITLT